MALVEAYELELLEVVEVVPVVELLHLVEMQPVHCCLLRLKLVQYY